MNRLCIFPITKTRHIFSNDEQDFEICKYALSNI